MTGLLLVVGGAVLSALGFPRIGPGWLILPGIALFLAGLRTATNRSQGVVLGAVYGLVFYSGLLWWFVELGLVAVIPLVLLQTSFVTAYAWWLSRYNDRPSGTWFLLAVGGWAVMELIRYRIPFGGFEWGAAGYALSDQAWARFAAPIAGASGITVLVVVVAALAVLELTRQSLGSVRLLAAAPLVAVALLSLTQLFPSLAMGQPTPVAIVQGSTPCPFEHCPPDERLRTFQQHLDLTRTIEPGSAFLVVWSEGSTGGLNADPVQNPEIGAAIGAEARRIGAWFLVGSDRPLDDEVWVNVNVLFNPDGEIVGEYQKQHPVPFGEYIPFRPLFEWIPELDRVPRDMIPGEGPVVFDTGALQIGSVISFEGSFSRYARQHVRAGADVIVVATNEGSYGTTPGSDQLVGMTRMRAAELGLDLVHAAVTGRSLVIDHQGAFVTDLTELGAQQVVFGAVSARPQSLYAQIGDVLMIATAAVGLVTWWRVRRPLVGSPDRTLEEE